MTSVFSEFNLSPFAFIHTPTLSRQSPRTSIASLAAEGRDIELGVIGILVTSDVLCGSFPLKGCPPHVETAKMRGRYSSRPAETGSPELAATAVAWQELGSPRGLLVSPAHLCGSPGADLALCRVKTLQALSRFQFAYWDGMWLSKGEGPQASVSHPQVVLGAWPLRGKPPASHPMCPRSDCQPVPAGTSLPGSPSQVHLAKDGATAVNHVHALPGPSHLHSCARPLACPDLQ